MEVITKEVTPEERHKEIMSAAEKRYKELKTIAYYEPGISSECELSNVPKWFDPTKYERCMYLARKYFVRYVSLERKLTCTIKCSCNTLQISNRIYPIFLHNSSTVQGPLIYPSTYSSQP